MNFRIKVIFHSVSALATVAMKLCEDVTNTDSNYFVYSTTACDLTWIGVTILVILTYIF